MKKELLTLVFAVGIVGSATASVFGSKTVNGNDYVSDVSVSVSNNVVHFNGAIPVDTNSVKSISINPISNAATVNY